MEEIDYVALASANPESPVGKLVTRVGRLEEICRMVIDWYEEDDESGSLEPLRMYQAARKMLPGYGAETKADLEAKQAQEAAGLVRRKAEAFDKLLEPLSGLVQLLKNSSADHEAICKATAVIEWILYFDDPACPPQLFSGTEEHARSENSEVDRCRP